MAVPTNQPVRPSRRGPLLALLLLGAFLGGCLTLYWPRLAGAKWAARLGVCNYNLKRIELALHAYHDEHGSFPPAVTSGPDSRPRHSWRALILPHMGAEGRRLAARYRLDEPWDGPHNRMLAGDPDAASLFRCPTEDAGGPVCSSYLAVIGEGTLWPPDRAATRSDLRDDPAGTLHVVEYSESGIVWCEPRDPAFESQTFGVQTFGVQTFGVQTGDAPTVRSRHPSLPYVAFADGRVRPLFADTPPDTVRAMLLLDDGGPVEGDVR